MHVSRNKTEIIIKCTEQEARMIAGIAAYAAEDHNKKMAVVSESSSKRILSQLRDLSNSISESIIEEVPFCSTHK